MTLERDGFMSEIHSEKTSEKSRVSRFRPRASALNARRAWLSCLLVFGAAAVLAFQNCTQGVQVDEGAISSEAAKLSFSYDSAFDQIAYMSCGQMSDQSFDKSAYFTLRAGAYRVGGIGLTEQFRKDMEKRSPQRQADILSESPVNVDTVPQLAVRSTSDLGTVVANSDSRASADLDYANMLVPLGGLDISEMLANLEPGARLRYVRDGTAMGRRFEGSLHFGADVVREKSLRSFLQGQSYFLTLTYTLGGNGTPGTGDATLPRGPTTFAQEPPPSSDGDATAPPPRTGASTIGSGSGQIRTAWGRGYRISFKRPDGFLSDKYPMETVLSEVSESSLISPADRSGAGKWVCPNIMQFRIVRAEDVSKPEANCARVPDPAVLSPELAIVRNSLKSEDWFVDMARRCIIPKKAGSGCYGKTETIVYNPLATCSDSGNPACIAMASICYRAD